MVQQQRIIRQVQSDEAGIDDLRHEVDVTDRRFIVVAECGCGLAPTQQLFQRFVIPNYKRYPVCLVRGEGSYVWDDQGRRYLDLFPGWGCNLLGHCPAPVVAAVQEQVAQLIHWSLPMRGSSLL